MNVNVIYQTEWDNQKFHFRGGILFAEAILAICHCDERGEWLQLIY